MASNNIQTEAVWTMNEAGISEIRLNYFDVDGKSIGNIDVTSRGEMRWQIINLEYMDYFNEIISYIYGANMSNKIVYHSKDANALRWTKTRLYIAKRGLFINYNVEVNYSNEFERGFVK